MFSLSVARARPVAGAGPVLYPFPYYKTLSGVFATNSVASLRMLPCRTHCPRPSICIMYLWVLNGLWDHSACPILPRDTPPKASQSVGFGGLGDGEPPGAGRAWMGL